MAFDYAALRTKVDAVVEKFGQAAVIRRTTSSGDAWAPTQSTADTSCTALVAEYKIRDRDGSRIQATDRRVLVKAGGLAVVPTSGDKFVLDSTAYDIVAVAPVAPGGVAVVYELQVRF